MQYVTTFRHATPFHVRILVFLLVGLFVAGALAAPDARAQTVLDVNSVADDSDADLTDGQCRTAANECTLRAALQEISAEDISERWVVEFDQIPTATENGRQVARIQTASELDLNGSNVQLRGDTAPGWQAGDPPIVYIDGSSATGSATDGLELRASADTVSIIGLGIVGFPDDGINLLGSASGDRPFHVAIQYNWIGIEPDGTTNGNGFGTGFGDQGAGIDLSNPRNVTIGASGVSGFSSDPISNVAVIFATGGENVIGGNAEMGINIFASSTSSSVDRRDQINRVVVSNNFIGLLPDGATPRGNGTYGIKIENSRENYIGYVNSSQERFPNYIAGNASGGLFIDSETIQVVGNVMGTTADATSTSMALAPGQDGILLQNPERAGVNYIGEVPGDGISGQYNIIGGYGYGVRAGTDDNTNTDGAEADREFIQDNYFGVSPGGASLPIRQAGVYAQFADSLRIDGNRFGNIGGGGTEDAAISLPLSEIGNHQIENNLIGVLDDGSAHPINGDGIYFGNPGGSDSFIDSNFIGNATRNGIYVFDQSNVLDGPNITNNSIGTTANGADIGNGDAGIRFFNAQSGVVGSRGDQTDPDADGNLIGFNGGPGVAVTGADSRTVIRGNTFRDNAGPMIDLGDDGNTPNDGADGDADTGPNKLLNTPEIVSFDCQPGLSADDLTLTYRVRTTSGNASFDSSDGILVDVYAGSTPNNVDSYLTTDTYQSGFTNQTVIVSAVNLCDQYLFLTTTDDLTFSTSGDPEERSTSEFFSPAPLLPVELVSFDATVNGTDVQLAWTTASETNNAGFSVEHQRPDAADWRDIGFVKGSGTTNEATSYRLRVKKLAPGTHAFRLRQRDTDGATELSDVVTVEVRLDGIYELRVGPNPMRQQGTVSLVLREGQRVAVTLYDLLGRRVATLHSGRLKRGTTTLPLSTDGLSSGQYFLRVQGQAFSTTKTILVAR
jgi:hypothetical protein